MSPGSPTNLQRHATGLRAWARLCLGIGAISLVAMSGPIVSGGRAAPVPFSSVIIEPAQASWGKGLADIDGDGFPDALEGGGNQGGSVFWYRYPDWTKFEIGSTGGGDDLQAGDVNGDGAIDVVVNGDAIAWYENPRASGGNPQAPWTRHTIDASTGAHDLVLGDVDADGRMDVLTRIAFGPSFLYFQTSPGSWTMVPLPTAPGGLGSALADIDRDCRLDVVGNGYWLEQPANPVTGVWVNHTFADWPIGSSVDVADVNGDGRLDASLAPSEVGVGTVAWFEAPQDPASGAWTRHDIDTAADVHHHFLADLDKDGAVDVVFAEMHQSSTRRVGVYWNDGTGASFLLQVLATTGSHNIALGDVDSDGDVDILGANWSGGSPDGGALRLWRNDLNTKLGLDSWTHVVVDTARLEPGRWLADGDLDADGREDIVAGRAWYRNPGDLTGTWTANDLGTGMDGMAVFDVDCDGRLDVIAEGPAGPTDIVVFWLRSANTQATSWISTPVGTIPSTGSGSRGHRLGQIAPGGSPELVLTSSDGVFYLQVPASPASGSWPTVRIALDGLDAGVDLADIDQDGDLDLAGLVRPSGTTVAWWENPDTGSPDWTRHDLGVTSGIPGDRVAVTDVSGDGRPDVIVTEANSTGEGNAVYWFERPVDPLEVWVRHTIASDLGSLNSMDVGDVNADGKPDIVTGERFGALLRVSVWGNLNGGTFWTSHDVSHGVESDLGTRFADLDGDGDLDLVTMAWDDYRTLHLWRNNGVASVVGVPDRPPGAPRIVSLTSRPNPFQSSALIELRVGGRPLPGRLAIRVYDTGGRLVRTLAEGLPWGPATAWWDGTTKAGDRVGSGVYYLRLEMGTARWTRRVVFLK